MKTTNRRFIGLSHLCLVVTSQILCLWLLLSTPAVLQGSEHPCGINRSGGMDQPGHDQRLGQPSQHSGNVPVLETQTAPHAPQRQCSAHHVSRSLLHLPLESPMCHSLPSPMLVSPYHFSAVTSCTPVAIVQLEVITSGILCLQGEGVPGHHHRAGTSQSHVLRLPVWWSERGERV